MGYGTATDLFGTIIVDYYKENESNKIFDSLDLVCNKKDNYSFDGFGVYFFWDYYTKEILYFGITNNMHRRFGEHNGFSEVKNPDGIKYEKICNTLK